MVHGEGCKINAHTECLIYYRREEMKKKVDLENWAARVATKCHMEACSQGFNLWPCWCLRLCCYQIHPELSALCFHLEPGCRPGQG